MDIKVTQDTDWGARAAFEAQRLINENLDGVEILAWGTDSRDLVLWMNLNSGDVNLDIAVSREFWEYGFFNIDREDADGYYRAAKPAFLNYIEVGRPGFFQQNGVGRFIYGLDLEAEGDCDVKYHGDEEIPDFTEQEAAEKAEREKLEEEWAVAEKERQKAAKEAAKRAKEKAAKAKEEAEAKAAAESGDSEANADAEAEPATAEA